jgi:MoaA/NifB/PqqE/SkfB family radical SAM enzyme
MRDPSTITLAIGFYSDRPMEVARLERFTRAATQLTEYYSRRSLSFWVDGANETLALRRLIKAVLFVNYRQPVEYLLLVNNLDRLDIQAVSRLMEQVEETSEGACAVLRGKKEESRLDAFFDMALIPLGWICRLAEATESAGWVASADEGNPYQVLLGFLRASGCPIAELECGNPESPAVHAPHPYRIPREVHFLPATGGTAAILPIGELSARMAAAFSAVAEFPAGARVAVYGAGTIGRAILPLLGSKAALVVDRNPELQGGSLGGVPLITPAELARHLGEFDRILITVLGREAEIRTTLTQYLGASLKDVTIHELDGRCTQAETEERDTPPVNIDVSVVVPPDMPKAKVRASDLHKETHRTLTRRGVLYVGYPCNIRCRFCYYAHSDNREWHPIEECKRDATLYRQEYGNECVDITGGEPTVYPRIFELLDHCGEIGLRPSLITNMQALRDEGKVKRFRDHGVYDFLCSIHGMGDVYNHITDTTSGWQNILRATRNLERAGMRWRANCTMVNMNMRQLTDIARYAYEYGARVINFINYNPFYEWANKLVIDFQARHSEIAPYLLEALDYCDSVGLEANVRYLPFCQMPGHEEKCYNYSQLSYDHHEWDYCSWYSDVTRNPSSKMPRWMKSLADTEDELHLHLAQHNKETGFAKPVACQRCALSFICDGPTTQYARRFGVEEFQMYEGTPVQDPGHFLRRQAKVVDEATSLFPSCIQPQEASKS